MRRSILSFLLIAALPGAGVSLAGGEIHGTVTTIGGDRYTGPIRWDHNENFWDDVLDAYRVPDEADEDRDFEIRLFGWTVARFGDDTRRWAQLTVAFGHLRSIEPVWDGGAVITLKNGEVVESPAGADIGKRVRGIVVERSTGPVELEWDDVERVDFSAAPAGGERDAKRLYGTVETETGPFTGYVVWDRDESLADDVLDGEEDGVDREIPFSRIRSIEKVDRRGSRVLLADETSLVLRGTNDVDDDNRGIDVSVAGLGRVRIGWDGFRSVTFTEPPPSPPYDAFDGGRPLSGAVRTREGREVEGTLVWDRDERFSWEALDAESGDVKYMVTFDSIRSIRPGDDGAVVVLQDGEELVLGGSNDVDRGNRGILVTEQGGTTHELDWADVEIVTFR